MVTPWFFLASRTRWTRGRCRRSWSDRPRCNRIPWVIRRQQCYLCATSTAVTSSYYNYHLCSDLSSYEPILLCIKGFRLFIVVSLLTWWGSNGLTCSKWILSWPAYKSFALTSSSMAGEVTSQMNATSTKTSCLPSHELPFTISSVDG